MADEPPTRDVTDATFLLNAAADGDRAAAERLLLLVYEQLRRAAQNEMAGEQEKAQRQAAEPRAAMADEGCSGGSQANRSASQESRGC